MASSADPDRTAIVDGQLRPTSAELSVLAGGKIDKMRLRAEMAAGTL